MAKGRKTLIHPVSGEEFEYEAAHADWILSQGEGRDKWWTLKEDTKKGKDAGKRRTVKAKATEAPAPEDDCGCH